MSDTPVQARVRATKQAAHGFFLTDETLKTERQWSWTPEARAVVRELLDAIPHDLDANWTPGTVYIQIHRDGQVILDLEAGYIACFTSRAPDVAAWLDARLAEGRLMEKYQQPAEAAKGSDFFCFTLPGAAGRNLGMTSGPRSTAVAETETCTVCFTKKSLSGACLCS